MPFINTPAPKPADLEPPKTDAAYWEKKQALEFRRMASMNAVNAAYRIVAESFHGPQPPTLGDAANFAKVMARDIYLEFYKPLERKEESDDIPF